MISSFKTDREPEAFLIESFPLAKTIRELIPLNSLKNVLMVDLDIRTSDKGFWLKWGIRILKLIAFILFFSIPHFIASLLTTITGYISALSNLVVIILSMIYSVSFIYVFNLILGLMLYDEQWFIGIIAIIVLFFSIKVLVARISYHRCPFCHSFFKASDLGSAVTGKTHVTEHSHQDVYKGTTETSTQIIHNYERQYSTEKTTELEIEDYRICDVCSGKWEVSRFKTVKGHV